VAILKVAQLGHPVLRTVASPVDPAAVRTAGIQQLIADMLDTMDEYDGAGLAAPQVHVPLRVVVLTLADEDPPDAWINPVLTPLTDHTGAIYEGCLSVAGLRGRVERPAIVHATWLDRDGVAQARVLVGFPAIVAQHECDHLDGILYVDRVDTRSLAFVAEFRKFGPLHRLARTADLDDDDDDDDGDDLDLEGAIVPVDPALTPAQALAVARGVLEL
jgi:peptide deformylase